ncbi:MAG: ABC transporter permease [Actinomycetia bacterium]|nr:ABC transporter permease [Actinomycetes bacterium]
MVRHADDTLRPRLRLNLRTIAGYLLALVIIIAVWALLAWIISSPALPLPWEAIEQFFITLPQMLPHILISLWRVIAAMLLGTALGLPLGLFIGRSARADRLAAPLLYILYPIPKVVFLPVLMVLMGLGNAPKIVLIATVVFFQMLVTARGAAHAIAPESITSVRSLGATPIQIAQHVIVPSALPDIFTALRICIGTAIAVLFLAESIAGSTGIGYYIMNAWSRLDYVAMFAGIIAMGAMGVGLYEILNIIEHRAVRWKKQQ